MAPPPINNAIKIYFPPLPRFLQLNETAAKRHFVREKLSEQLKHHQDKADKSQAFLECLASHRVTTTAMYEEYAVKLVDTANSFGQVRDAEKVTKFATFTGDMKLDDIPDPQLLDMARGIHELDRMKKETQEELEKHLDEITRHEACLLYTSPSPRD